MINWFRNSAKDQSKPQVPLVKTPKTPKRPKSIAPKIKKHFLGPKSPLGYKRKLYVPLPFIHAQGVEAPVEEETYQVGLEGNDPVTLALQTLGPLRTITWKKNPAASYCSFCDALDGRTWPSAEAFGRDKRNLVKPGRDTLHLAHNNCSCYLEVEAVDGTRFKVDATGILS